MPDPLIIGLTGGIGSGKSAAMKCFESLGVPCIDADIVARQVVEPGEPALAHIAEHFGPDVISESGQLDRARLRQLVFSHADEKKWLESLLHPLINQRIRQWLADCGAPYCILSSPLLLETTQHQLVNRILVIDVPESLQLARTMARDSNDEAQVKAIMASQSSRSFKQASADDIILNDQDLESLAVRVNELHHKYLQLSEKS